jgi:hypothetical protein
MASLFSLHNTISLILAFLAAWMSSMITLVGEGDANMFVVISQRLLSFCAAKVSINSDTAKQN